MSKIKTPDWIRKRRGTEPIKLPIKEISEETRKSIIAVCELMLKQMEEHYMANEIELRKELAVRTSEYKLLMKVFERLTLDNTRKEE